MPQLFNIPEYGLVSYPDDATPDEIQAHIDQYFAPRVEQIFTDRADRIERGRQAEGYEPPSAIRSAAESIGGAITQLPSRLGRDLPLDIASGIVAVPEAAVGLADIPTGGRAGRLAEDLGVDFKGTKSYFESLQSPERQEERQRIQAAEGWKDTALQIAQSPGTVLGAVASSLPLMGSGGAVASKVTEWAPKLGALGTALSKVPAFAIGEGLVAAGSAAEQIRQQTPDRLLTPTQSALAAATGVATGGLGVLGGKAAAKLGIDDIDAIMSGAMPVNQKGSVLASVLKGALTEGVLEELPQSVSEQFFQNVALGRPRDEALAEAAVLGLLSGSLTGGALQPYLINEARRTKAAQDLAAQRQQVQDNLAKIRDDAEKLRQRSGALPPTLPASPTPSAPTTATRGPTGAPAPTVDAPLAGESPLPPSATAGTAIPSWVADEQQRLASVADSLGVRTQILDLAKTKTAREIVAALPSLQQLPFDDAVGVVRSVRNLAGVSSLDVAPPTSSQPVAPTKGALDQMTREDYAAYLALNPRTPDGSTGQMAFYRELTKRPELRGQKEVKPSEADQSEIYKRRVPAIANAMGVPKRVNNPWMQVEFGDHKTKNADGSRSKLYLTFKDWRASWTPAKMGDFVRLLRERGFNGSAKTKGNALFVAENVLNKFDDVVVHARNDNDIEIARQAATDVWGDAINFDTGLDATNPSTGEHTSHTDLLAAAVAKAVAKRTPIELPRSRYSPPTAPAPAPAPQPPTPTPAPAAAPLSGRAVPSAPTPQPVTPGKAIRGAASLVPNVSGILRGVSLLSGKIESEVATQLSELPPEEVAKSLAEQLDRGTASPAKGGVLHVARPVFDKESAFNLPPWIRPLALALSGVRFFGASHAAAVLEANPDASLVDFIGDIPTTADVPMSFRVTPQPGYETKVRESVNTGLPRDASSLFLSREEPQLVGKIDDVAANVSAKVDQAGNLTRKTKLAIAKLLDARYGKGRWVVKDSRGAAGSGIFNASTFLSQKVPLKTYVVERFTAGIASPKSRHFRVHGISRNGRVEIVPYATQGRLAYSPFFFRTDFVKSLEAAAQTHADGMQGVRDGGVFGFDVVLSPEGAVEVVEVNPSDTSGRSGYVSSPFTMLAIASYLKGEVPGHVLLARVAARRSLQRGAASTEAGDFVLTTYRNAKDLADFTAQMVKHFGAGVAEFTEAIWLALKRSKGQMTSGLKELLARLEPSFDARSRFGIQQAQAVRLLNETLADVGRDVDLAEATLTEAANDEALDADSRAKYRRALDLLLSRKESAAPAPQPPTPTPTPAPNAPAAVRQQPGVPVQPAQAPQGGVSPKAGAGDSAVGAKAKPAAKEAAVADELDRLETIESVGQLSAKQAKRLAELRAKAAAQPAPVQPVAQPAPAQPAPVQPVAQPAPAQPVAQPAPAAGAPRPLTPSEATFQAALSRMTQESAQTFQHLWDTAVQSPGGSVQSTLARMAEEVASGALQAKLEGIASVLGIDNVGPLQVLPVGDPDLTRWGDNANQKTGGFVVRGGQVFLDPYGYFADLFGNPVLQAKTIAHELWHVVTARVITRMVQARAQEQGLTLEAAVASVYQELFAALPRDFVSAARKTAWGDSQVVAVEEYIRAALEKFGAPRIAKFSDLTDANVRKALSGAAVTEELSQREGEEVREALVKAMLSLDLSGISSLKGKGIVERVRNFLSTMANLFRNEPGTVPPLVIQVIDESLKAVTGVKPAAVKVKPAAVKVKAVAAETPRGGGRMKEGADVGAIRESRSSARLTTAMAAITQSLAERPESFRTSFEAAFSQIVGEEGLPTEGLSADYFYTELAKQLAKIPLTAEKVPDRFVSNLRRSKETKGRVRTPQKTPVETAPPLAIAAAPGLVGQPALGFQIAATYELITALPTLSGEQRTRVQDLITRMADPAFELTPQAVSSALGRPVSEAGVNAETGVPFGVSPAAQNFARLLQVLQDNPNDRGAEIAVARVIRETGVPPEYLRPALQHLLALRQASQGEAIPAQASVTTEEAEDMQEFQDVAGERRKALPATSSYGFWVSPTGELIPTSYHPATAAEILGDSATPEQLADVRVLYQMMQERGYLRMVREAADDYTVDLLVDQRPNSAQRAALENFGINQEKNITLLRGNRGELFYSVPEAPSWLDRVFGDRRKALPATQGDEDLGAAETRLRGAATSQSLNTLTEALAQGLNLVDRRLSDTDQERLQQTRLSAYRQSLRDAMAIINNRLSDQGAEEAISLGDEDAFEAAIENPEIRASLDRANQPANDALRQLRQEVLAEQQAQQQVRDTLRLAELQAVYEVLSQNSAHAKLAKRVDRKIKSLENSLGDPTPRTRELLAYRAAEVDRAAAARANASAPLRWLRTLGKFATSDSPVNALPLSARSPEEINRALDAWDQEGTGFGEPSLDPDMIQEGLSPQEQQFVLRARASQWGSEAEATRLQAQRFFFSFDNLRRQAFRTLQEKGAELHKDIARISRDLIQAKAEMSQKQLDLREAMQLAQRDLPDIPADQRDFLLQHETAINTIAERYAELLNDPDAGARAAQVLGFFTSPLAGEGSATQIKALASELRVGDAVFARLADIISRSPAARGVLLDYLNRVEVEGLLPRLQRLQAAANNPALDNPDAFDPTSPNYREARAAYQDAMAARDGVMADVVGGLRSGIASGASTVSKLINQLRSRSVDLRALEQTSEVFENIAANPQFQAARSDLDQGVFSLPQLIAPNADGKLEFRAFGMKDPQTGEPGLIYHAGFAVDPSDYNRTKVANQVRDYVAKLFEYRNAFAHARLNYTANAGPPPSQLGFDSPTLTAVETALNKDAALYSALYLTSPELVSGAEGAAARFIPGWNYLQRLQFPGIGLLSKVEPGVVAAKAAGFFGSLLRPATGSLTRALQDIEGELTSAYDPADPDKGMSHLRRKAVLSHTDHPGEVGLPPIQDFDTYRKEVFNFVAALGLSRNPKLLKAGTFNPTSGRVITQEDIDFLKAQSDFNTKVYAKMQRRADRAIVEKHGDSFFSRFAQSPARFKANRFGSERMGKFVESAATVDSEKTLLSGSPEAFDFWNSPDALGRAVAHVAGAAFDSANDAVTYRANMREAEEQLATRAMQGSETFRDVTSIDELAAKIAAMPAARGLLPAQVREGLYYELDQLSRNARQMAQELRVEGENLLNDVNLDWVKLRRLSADNQFANPWGPRKLSFDLYDYGLLTDGDAHRFTRNAVYREMVDYGIALDNALKEVRMLIDSQKEARRTGTTSAAFEEAFTSEAEAATYEMQLAQLQASYADFVSGYRPRRWFDVLARIFDFQTQAVLASPTVTIKNLLFGSAMAHVAFNRRDLGQMRYGVSGTTAKFFFRSAGEFGKNIISTAILTAAKRARISNPHVPLGKVERWAARVKGRNMVLRGLGGSSRTSLITDIRRGYEALQIKDTPEGRTYVLPERYADLEVWLGMAPVAAKAALKKVGTMAADAPLNLAALVSADALEQDFMAVADRYYDRLVKEGLLDPNNLQASVDRFLTNRDPKMAVKASDFSDQFTLVNNEARLQDLRRNFEFIGRPIDDMFLDWIVRRSTNPDAQLFVPEDRRAYLQALIQDVNAPNFANRPLSFATNQELAYTYRLMGYGINAGWALADFPTRVRRTQQMRKLGLGKGKYEGPWVVDASSMGWATSTALAFMIVGALGMGAAELYRRLLQRTEKSRDTVFDPDLWTSGDLKRWTRTLVRDGISVIPVPLVPETLHLFLNVDPFGKGFDGVAASFFGSALQAVVSEAVTAGTTIRALAKGETMEDAVSRTQRQAINAASRWVPGAKELFAMLGAAGVDFFEGRQKALQERSAERFALSLNPDLARRGGAASSARAALTMSPSREPVRMLVEAAKTGNTEQYQQAMRMLQVDWQSRNKENAEAGRKLIEWDDYLRSVTETSIPFRTSAQRRPTEAETANMLAAMTPDQRQRVAEQVAAVEAIRGTPVTISSREASSGGGGGAALPTSSLRLPGIGRVSVGGGGGGGGSRLSRSRRRRPRLTLGGRGRNLSRLRVRRLRSPRNRLLRRRRA